MSEQTLARARAGDEDAFRELTDPYRRELQLHVYRIVGSAQDSEDLLQETLLAAWRDLGQFQGRASVRAWLYRIATNRSLDALRARRRRPEDVPRLTGLPEPTRRTEPLWLEPFPDVLLEDIPDDAPGPDARYETKEAIALAFVAGLQHLPPRQRAVLVLRDVLGFRAARSPGCSAPPSRRSTASCAARGPRSSRACRPARAPLPGSKAERDVVGRFADALEAGDVDGVVALLTDDAWLTMPPVPLEYRGRRAVGVLLRNREDRRGAPLRLVPTRANTQPAFGCYLDREPRGLLVLTLEGEQISAMAWFESGVFASFGLPG